MYKLRTHQEEMQELIDSSIMFGEKKIIVDACPAFGKSLQMAETALRHKKDGVAILINISALLPQIAHHLDEQGVKYSILSAKHDKLFNPKCKVQLIMSQTLHARRHKLIFKHKFKVYQQDEGHREHPDLSKRTRENIEFLNPDVQLLYSGTPFDSEGFSFPGYTYLSTVKAKDLQDAGYLCKINYMVPKWSEALDFSNIKKSGADYNTTELDKIINTTNHLELCVGSMNDVDAKSKKTLVFASSIEQAEHFTEILCSQGYNAAAYHSKSKDSKLIMDAFTLNRPYIKSLTKEEIEANKANLFKSASPKPAGKMVTCLVSINKLGIGFDCPDVQLGVQLRPTGVYSLFIQQVMRLARNDKSKKFSEYLDLGQTASRFGFHTDVYNPPARLGDPVEDGLAINEAMSHLEMKNLSTVLDEGVTALSRDDYEARLQKLKKELELPYEKMTNQQLGKCVALSNNHKEVIMAITQLYTNVYGKPVSKNNFEYNYRPEGFWGTNTFGSNEHFHVHLTMEEYFLKYPHKADQWLKALKTRCINIFRGEMGLFKITGFIKFLADKYEEQHHSIISEYSKKEKKPPTLSSEHHFPEIDIELDDIPFSITYAAPILSAFSALEWYSMFI